MNFDLIFSLVNLSVMPAWALLVFGPNWSVTHKLVHSMLYPLILGAVYAGLFLLSMMGLGAEGGSFTTIEGVRNLFSTDVGIVIGWSHYLVFDLFVGAWLARDGKRRGVSHLLLIPCLFFSFMLGPIGLLLYVILRKVTGKGGWSLFES